MGGFPKASMPGGLAAHVSRAAWLRERPRPMAPTGIASLDALTGGLPCGAVTEIYGAASSGRTSLLHRLLAEATAAGKMCALVDACDAFDPVSAEAAGVSLPHLVWTRCRRNIEHAIKAADLLLHGGGFGLVALDLCDLDRRTLQRIPTSYWFRFRRAVEETPAAFVVLSDGEPQSRSCASFLLETRRANLSLSGKAPNFQLLRAVQFQLIPRKPVRSASVTVVAQALA